jgi:hypothetical protein
MGRMSLSIYMKGDYEDFHALKASEKQSQTNPISVSPQHCWGLKANLKKQSQFVPNDIYARAFLKRVYGNMPASRAEKNKAKQSQTKPISVPATGFIVYNPLDTGCRILGVRRVSRNFESRIEIREYD